MSENKYKYVWSDDPKQTRFDTEEALKESFPEACDVHDYKSAYTFGTYVCRNCKVQKVVK